MVGFVADDIGVGGGGPGRRAKPRSQRIRATAQRLYGDQAAAFLKLYPVSPRRRRRGRAEVRRTRSDACVHGSLGRRAGKASKRIYTYYFDRSMPWPAHPEFGAFHTSEVPYVFKTIARIDRPWEPVDKTVSDTVSSYWTNFASKGDPNGPGLPPWPAYDASTHTTMQLGPRTGAMRVAEPGKLEFFLAQ